MDARKKCERKGVVCWSLFCSNSNSTIVPFIPPKEQEELCPPPVAHTNTTMPMKKPFHTITNSNNRSYPIPLGIRPVAAQVGVGIACASFWRGMWYLLDDNLFPNNPLYSATASLATGTAGLALTQGYISHKSQQDAMNHVKKLP
eukprot:10574058-Ditylum_brightwellii.AAC.1